MRKKIVLYLIMFFLLGCNFSCAKKSPEPPLQKVQVTKGNIKSQISASAIVEPRNRLEIKPPVSGRIEKVLVKEGEKVKKGQILAWMSSQDRAAILDSARAKGEEEFKHWEEVYRPTPIVAPLDGFIILRAVEPGQTVTFNETILVMADHLIVKAQVDETDLSQIKLKEPVNIELDAYQGQIIKGRVEHIAYESKIINNVTIYEVNVLPEKTPEFFRSGMSATCNFILAEKKDVLIVPLNTVAKIGNRSYVFIQKPGESKPVSLQIKTGLENSNFIEVVDGLNEGDEIIIPTEKILAQFKNQYQRQRGPRFFNPFAKE